jgi:hypothetical protein
VANAVIKIINKTLAAFMNILTNLGLPLTSTLFTLECIILHHVDRVWNDISQNGVKHHLLQYDVGNPCDL